MADEENIKESRKRRRRSKGSQTEGDEEDPTPPPCCGCSETLNTINEKLDQALSAIKEIHTLKVQVSELQSKNNHLEESLNFAHSEIDNLKNRLEDLEETISYHQQDVRSLHEEMKLEKARGVKLESHSRRNNLRFFNIPEQPGNENYHDTERVLREFLENNLSVGHDLATTISIDRAHRTPATKPPNTAKPRPIIAKFCFFKEKETDKNDGQEP